MCDVFPFFQCQAAPKKKHGKTAPKKELTTDLKACQGHRSEKMGGCGNKMGPELSRSLYTLED